MPHIGLFRILFILIAIPLLSSCNSSRDDSALLGDMDSSLRCPVTGCADATPSSDSVYIQRDAVKSTFLGAGDSVLELSGSCSASTFPDNRIEVTSNGNPVTFYSVNMGSTAMIPKCSMGRFFIYIDACKFPAISGYTLQVTLRALDGSQQPVSSDSSFMATFNRTAAPNGSACP